MHAKSKVHRLSAQHTIQTCITIRRLVEEKRDSYIDSWGNQDYCLLIQGESLTDVHMTFKPLNSSENVIFGLKHDWPLWSLGWDRSDPPHPEKNDYSVMVNLEHAIIRMKSRKRKEIHTKSFIEKKTEEESS